jgi:hypothetical protein
MAKGNQKSKKEKSNAASSVQFKSREEAAKAEAPFVHIYYNGAICETDKLGHATPRALSPAELAVDASEGFIPLWADGVTLRWRFQERSMTVFQDPMAAKDYLRDLFGQALVLWGDAVPVRFTEARDAWDFEIVVSAQERCNPNGCTLASAFFPESGQNELNIYPTMFEQSSQEQIETMAHELGHVFGLRHFFAQITETRWRSELFGDHQPFSIMNYGPQSVMTPTDRDDLKEIYRQAWSGELMAINDTPIQLVDPFSSLRFQMHESSAVARRPAAVAFRSQR